MIRGLINVIMLNVHRDSSYKSNLVNSAVSNSFSVRSSAPFPIQMCVFLLGITRAHPVSFVFGDSVFPEDRIEGETFKRLQAN